MLLVFLFLRLASSSAGRARLRRLVPHIDSGQTRDRGFSSLHKKQKPCKSMTSVLVGVAGFEPTADREKHSRLTRLERCVMLLVFLFLRLASSSAGRARLRRLVPHIDSGQTRDRGFSSLHKKQKPCKSMTSVLVGVAGFEPTASWSRTKRATICATPRLIRECLTIISAIAEKVKSKIGLFLIYFLSRQTIKECRQTRTDAFHIPHDNLNRKSNFKRCQIK